MPPDHYLWSACKSLSNPRPQMIVEVEEPVKPVSYCNISKFLQMAHKRVARSSSDSSSDSDSDSDEVSVTSGPPSASVKVLSDCVWSLTTNVIAFPETCPEPASRQPTTDAAPADSHEAHEDHHYCTNNHHRHHNHYHHCSYHYGRHYSRCYHRCVKQSQMLPYIWAGLYNMDVLRLVLCRVLVCFRMNLCTPKFFVPAE